MKRRQATLRRHDNMFFEGLLSEERRIIDVEKIWSYSDNRT